MVNGTLRRDGQYRNVLQGHIKRIQVLMDRVVQV
jgi:hypothetical protein